ncbi:superoxide dismutase, Ni [Woeseiaceae bacterium]|jgi:nickel superoxide dismutase|nr:superoxide dismutase, Ni [Woeseiaceae bacterium]
MILIIFELYYYLIKSFNNHNKRKSMIKIKSVDAHCDIPCAIYDTSAAQYASLSVIRFLDLIAEIEGKTSNSADMAKFVRLIGDKDKHAQIVKNEIVVIWGDFFKAPQFEQFPESHELVHSIMMDASKCKQNLDRQNGLDLLDKVNRFSEIFWSTKGVEVETKIAPYAPNLPIVCPVLKTNS